MRSFLLALMLAAPASAAFAQDFGDPSRGHAFASMVCAECHFIERAGTPSPNTAAPPFAAVANTPGMTDVALAVFLYTPHPTMPNLVIPTPDARDIIAYILTLKR